MITNEPTQLILPVKRYSLDGGDLVVRCPHCKAVIVVGGRTPHDILGEQFQHRGCGGWLEVSYGATMARTV